MGRNTEWIDIEVIVETELAFKVSNGKNEAWVARSQIIDTEEDLALGVETRIELPMWFLEKAELV